MKMKRNKRFLGIFIFIAVFAASAAIVMLLWNWIVPSLIGWSVVGYWQAAGLLLLCRLLFGGFGKGGFHRHGHHYMGKRVKAKMHEKLKGMSDDERREYIRNYMFAGYPGGPCENTDGEK